MKIEFIRNFIKLTKYQSFSELADDLDISQSTLSHQISQLENELGVILINRTTRKFEITKEGKIFSNYGKQIIDLYDTCFQEILKINKDLIEDITITASTLPGSHFLPKFLAKFKEKNSNVDFKIFINNSKKSIDLLKKNMADFAGIGSFMDNKEDDFDIIKIGEDNLKFICSSNHKLVLNGNLNINFNDLKKYPFIRREEGSGTRDILNQQFKSYDELNILLEINDNDSIISTVSESNYISIISEHYAKKAENAGLIKILNINQYPIVAKRDIFFIKLKNKDFSGLKKKFWEYIKK